MEDRYLFKGKEKDSGKWLEWNAIAGIPHNVTILTNTTCQCTGLRDKNGNLIWENDVVKRNFRLYSSETKYEEKENKGIVKYDSDFARFGYQCSVFAMLGGSKKHDTLEVIGNIFDNPELLESEE